MKTNTEKSAEYNQQNSLEWVDNAYDFSLW